MKWKKNDGRNTNECVVDSRRTRRPGGLDRATWTGLPLYNSAPHVGYSAGSRLGEKEGLFSLSVLCVSLSDRRRTT